MRVTLPTLFALLIVCLFVAGSASAEMYKYTDSSGRLHFTQDIGQVPPQYRNQVQEQKLGRKISVTGEGAGKSPAHRVKAMKKRSRKLGATIAPTPARRAERGARAKNSLEGAPPPKKYHRECWWESGRKKCRKQLTHAWQRWDAANGGDNGKPVTRRKIGK
jgi:hypothetical protein